jgi:dCMP deaminase
VSASVSRTRPGWDEYFMGIARAVSTRMSCDRAQIGCVIISPDHRILSGGYGGAPSGWPSCDEVGHQMAEMATGDSTVDATDVEHKLVEIINRLPSNIVGLIPVMAIAREAFQAGRDSKPSRQSCIRTVHAEENAVCTAARHGVALDGSTLYTTASTCYDCLKMVAQAGIVRIVYGEVYSGARTAGMDIVQLARDRGIEMECLPMAEGAR